MKAELDKAKNGRNNLSVRNKNTVGMTSQSRTVVQAQLETTTSGDAYEQEADHMADMVMRKIDGTNSSDTRPANYCPTPTISCFGGTSMPISSQMENQLQSMQGSGHVMPDGLRSQMENSFGHDFSNVRIHTDSAAAEMSNSIHAKAFTHGNDIYFNQGQFQPNTASGQHLIAHELTHTMQQGGKVAREGIRSAEDVATDIDSIGDGVTYVAEKSIDPEQLGKSFKNISYSISILDLFLTPLAMKNNIEDFQKHGKEGDGYSQFLDASNFIGNLTSWSLWPLAQKVGQTIAKSIGSKAVEESGKIILEKTAEKAVQNTAGKAAQQVATKFAQKFIIKLGVRGLLGIAGIAASAAPYVVAAGTAWTIGTSVGDIINKAGYEEWQNHKMKELADIYGDSWYGHPIAILCSIPLTGDLIYNIHSIFSDLALKMQNQSKASNYKNNNDKAFDFVINLMQELDKRMKNLKHSYPDIEFAEEKTEIIITDYKKSGKSSFIKKLNTIKTLTGWVNSKPTYNIKLTDSQIVLIKEAISRCDEDDIETELPKVLNELKTQHEDISHITSLSPTIIEDYVMSGASQFEYKLRRHNWITFWQDGKPVSTLVVSDTYKNIIISSMKKIHLL